MKYKDASIEEVIVTFSEHLKKTYPSPDVFRNNLTQLLEDKRQRMGAKEYEISLEKNIVFLHDLIVEGEAFIDLLLRLEDKNDLKDEKINSMFRKMEEKIRDRMNQRHRDIFIKGTKEEFSTLFELKKNRHKKYPEKLEVNYRYLMTLRIILYEFFSVLVTTKSKYRVRRTGPAESKKILNHIDITANYYLGNVTVAESGGGTKKAN